MKKAIVLSFDRLNWSLLGCYGNQRIATPNFNRLAMQSRLFEQHFAEDLACPNFDAAITDRHAWWSGCHQFLRSSSEARLPSVISAMTEAGITAELHVQNSATTSATDLESLGFEHVRFIPCNGVDRDTPTDPNALAPMIDTAVDFISRETKRPSLLWLKFSGTRPSGINSIEDHDDWSIELERSSSDVATIDLRMQAVLEAIDNCPDRDELLLVVTAAHGDTVAIENQSAWWAEGHIHTPLIVFCPSQFLPGSREQTLTQSTDLAPTLLEWFEIGNGGTGCDGASLFSIEIEGVQPAVENAERSMSISKSEVRQKFSSSHGVSVQRDYLYLGGPNDESAIRTRDFFLVKCAETCRLFVKPDDLWNIYDVASQSEEDVELLNSTLTNFIEKKSKPASSA